MYQTRNQMDFNERQFTNYRNVWGIVGFLEIRFLNIGISM